MTYLDRSNYLRGLLLLARKDNKVNEEEVNMIMRIGTRLGFAYDFCKYALKGILDNEHIVDEPPKFSNKGIAQKFIREGIKLAKIDNDLDLNELEWIDSVIRENEMEEEWRINQVEYFNESVENEIENHLDQVDLISF